MHTFRAGAKKSIPTKLELPLQKMRQVENLSKMFIAYNENEIKHL